MKKEFSIKKNQEKSLVINPKTQKTYSNHFYSRKNSILFDDDDNEGVQSPTLKNPNFSKSELKREKQLRSTLIARKATRSKRTSLRKNWMAPKKTESQINKKLFN